MKNRIFIWGPLLVLGVLAFVLCERAFAAEKLTQIAENVYVYVGTKNSSGRESFGANAGVIIGKDGILVVDTLVSASEAKRLIRDIRTISRKRIRYVVNTHYHLDHAFGNSEFEKVGAILIAHEDARKAMEKSAEETLKNIGEYGLAPGDIHGTTPAYPVLTYGDRMTIDLGDQKIELIHARHAHTAGDTLVYLREKKVLFAGDTLFTDYHPYLGEGDIMEWAKELDDIKAMEVEKIIPGHGPLSGKKDLEDMKEYILLFDKKAKEFASRSDDVNEIVDALKRELPQRSEGAWLIGANVRMKYLKQQ